MLLLARSAEAQIANSFPGDVGIENSPEVVFVERMTGSVAAIQARFESVQGNANMTSVADVPPNVPLAETNSLRMTNPGGAPVNLLKNLLRINPAGFTTLWVRVYVKFEGGGTVWHHNGPNILGRSTPNGVGDADFTTGLCCTQPSGTDKFQVNAEIAGSGGAAMWMEMRGSGFIDPANCHNPVTLSDQCFFTNNFLPNPPVSTDAWHSFEIGMTLNNPATSRNGTLQIFVDGVQVTNLAQGSPLGSWNVNAWTSGVGSTPFDGFRWTADANLLKITNIWLNHFSDTAGAMRWSHLVVATKPIGPISAGGGDTLPPAAPCCLRLTEAGGWVTNYPSAVIVAAGLIAGALLLTGGAPTQTPQYVIAPDAAPGGHRSPTPARHPS